MNHNDPSDPILSSMHSIFGIHTIVTMECYDMCLSLIYALDIANSLYFVNIPYI